MRHDTTPLRDSNYKSTSPRLRAISRNVSDVAPLCSDMRAGSLFLRNTKLPLYLSPLFLDGCDVVLTFQRSCFYFKAADVKLECMLKNSGYLFRIHFMAWIGVAWHSTPLELYFSYFTLPSTPGKSPHPRSPPHSLRFFFLLLRLSLSLTLPPHRIQLGIRVSRSSLFLLEGATLFFIITPPLCSQTLAGHETG